MERRRNMNCSTFWNSQGTFLQHKYLFISCFSFFFHCHLYSSAHSFCWRENKNNLMVLLYYSTIFTHSGEDDDDDDDDDDVSDYGSNDDGWWCYSVFPLPHPTAPGRGCQSSCALHQERSAFIAKELWVSVCCYGNWTLRHLQLKPRHSRVLSFVKSQTNTQSRLPLCRLLFW